MPRIVPLQLLKCLKVLLDENGGILSQGEVKRIAGLMTKYSKKLVSKCIYVQILKCTKTELLGEFMGSGGWSLTHVWLNDAIRARNWPLVQEILELLLLCPVDVERLKSNSAPKLVKGLCKDGDDEGVRILASKLVEQWLKVVTGDATSSASQMAPKTNEISAVAEPLINPIITSKSSSVNGVKSNSVEEDPLGAVDPPMQVSFQPTLAQKKASESGLVLKCVVKDGKQVWARVDNTQKSQKGDVQEKQTISPQKTDTMELEDEMEEEQDIKAPKVKENVEEVTPVEKISEDTTDNKENKINIKKKDDKEKEKVEEKHKEKQKEKEKEKEKNKSSSSSDKDKDKKSSSSSHRSSSSHKSSSSSSKTSSSSSSNKPKSSHRSSTDGKSRDKDKEREKDKDKEREKDKDKEREKDKERSSNKERSSDKDKHRSSSSKSSSSSSSTNRDKDRHKDKYSSTSSSSSIKKDKEKQENPASVEKDKDTTSKFVLPSIDKLGKIPKKPKDNSEEQKPTSITIPSKKASMSIEIRRDSEKAKTVKTYKSQFRSHGLTEEAPPPPSRKGLKKPNSAPIPGTAIPNTLTLKRPSPPPTSLQSSLLKDSPAEKKPKIDMNTVSGPAEKVGAIKLIPPKKNSSQGLIFAVRKYLFMTQPKFVWLRKQKWEFHQFDRG